MSGGLVSSGSVVCFRVADQVFALSVGVVREVQRRVTLHPVLGLPPEICGAINLHGQIVPVLDLRQRLNLPPASDEIETSPDAALIIFQSHERLLALLADHVTGVVHLTPSAQSDQLTQSASGMNGMVLVDGQMLTMLDANMLMSTESQNRDITTGWPH